MATEILRPNGAGDEENIPYVVGDGIGSHWTTVDEETPDDDTTYIYSTAETYGRDLYALADHSLGAGTINKITVYGRFEALGYIPTWDSAKICIKAGGTAYEQAFQLANKDIWYDLSKEWAQNPNTGSPWIWSDIDALQVGCALRKPKTGATGRTKCTQLYIEVDYTSGVAKTSADSGAGSEGTPVPTATLAGSESGQGQEASSSQLMAKISADTGTATELGALMKELFTSEPGQGSDSLSAKIEAPTKGGGMKLWI